MPNNIKIEGNDVTWKRAVDDMLDKILARIITLENRVKFLESRVK